MGTQDELLATETGQGPDLNHSLSLLIVLRLRFRCCLYLYDFATGLSTLCYVLHVVLFHLSLKLYGHLL